MGLGWVVRGEEEGENAVDVEKMREKRRKETITRRSEMIFGGVPLNRFSGGGVMCRAFVVCVCVTLVKTK